MYLMKDKLIIQDFAEQLLENMRAAVPSVSGATAKSLELIIDSNGLGFQISADQQIGAIINGRKPTRKGATHKGGASVPTLQQAVLEWIKIKGIQPRGDGMSQLQLSWAMSKSIHAKGYKGRGNIFAGVLNKNLTDSISNQLANQRSSVMSSQLIKELDL